MMQPQEFQPSWPFYNVISSSTDLDFYGMDMDAYVDASQFSSSFGGTLDISDISSIFPSNLPGEFVRSPTSDDEFQVTVPCVEDFFMDVFDHNFTTQMEQHIFSNQSEGDSVSFTHEYLSSEGENVWSPSPSIKSSTEASMIPQPTLTLPGEDLQLDVQVSLSHLLNAYAEAMEIGQDELANVIMRCTSEKVNPAGEPLERLAFNLCHKDIEKQGDYIKLESCKNYEVAFRAFYQIFPYGRFAHLAANSAILESIPGESEIVHIMDFDLGEGIQWPTMIEALAHQRKELRLTAIKWTMEGCDWAPSMWSFDEAKRRLVDHARYFGLKLKVEEMEIEDLVKEANKRPGGRKEFLVFNCMVGLPHMGRIRSRQLLQEFLRVARDLLAYSSSTRGIIAIGNGDPCENLKDCASFGSFFPGHLLHYQALLDSIESNFPVHLAEARMAQECLFVQPYISSQDWFQKWMEIKKGCNLGERIGNGLKGWRVSRGNLEEAREMVNGEQSSYVVRIGGQQENQMILEWKATPLVRVSTWRN